MADDALLRRATIKEVAEAAGVSRSTASRAMAGNGYVAEKVRLRVREAADELGYVVDATARSLKQQTSRLIGVLVSDLRTAFYADFASGAARESRQRGYTMMLIDANGSPEDELEAAEAFVALRVAGVVGTPVSPGLTSFLSRQRIPVVEADRQFAEGESDAVVFDGRSAARATTEHLVALGHRRIALVLDELEWTTGRDRRAGYSDALAAAGIPADPAWVVSAGKDLDVAISAVRGQLSTADRPTAIIAANTVLAEGAWRAAASLGLAVPEELSLVSFDDAPWMSLVTPGVTSVAQDAEHLGATAITTLLERIADPSLAPRTVMLPAGLTVRGSTVSPRA